MKFFYRDNTSGNRQPGTAQNGSGQTFAYTIVSIWNHCFRKMGLDALCHYIVLCVAEIANHPASRGVSQSKETTRNTLTKGSGGSVVDPLKILLPLAVHLEERLTVSQSVS